MATAPDMKPADPWVGSTDQEKDSIQKLVGCIQSFEQGIGPEFRDRNDRLYRGYRGFKKFKNAWEAAGPNDRDLTIRNEGQRSWGSNLHIPYGFAIVELLTARAIAHRPKMLYLPRDEKWEPNVENVRMTLEAQQEQVELDLEYQDVMKDGFIYGIGIGKSYWREEYTMRRRAKPRMFRPGQYIPGKLERVCIFDDPDFDHVDPYDFMWDPMGDSTARGRGRRCAWVAHRTWISLEGALNRIKTGAWNTVAAKKIGEKELRTMGGRQRYDEIWNERMTASGFSAFHLGGEAGEHLHEVIEWHDGERVLTLLDRQVLVVDAENPCVGELPFHVYRPTKIPKQMVGIGEIEPIESLSRELDTLRSMQLDAGIIAMCAGYAYDDGAIEEEDLVFGPASAVRVTNARPQDALMPLPKPDLPSSSFQQASNIAADIERISGMTDALADQDGGRISTATEAQLVQASLSRRVAIKSRRFEAEVIRHNARVWLYLDQRMILNDRTYGQAAPPSDDPLANRSRREWFEVGPGELMGEFEIIPEGGSMAEENTQQKRQDAIQILQNFGQNPYVDPRQPLIRALELFDVKNPENWLAQKDPPVPPKALEILAQAGVDPQLLEMAVRSAQQADPQLPTPGVNDQEAAVQAAAA